MNGTCFATCIPIIGTEPAATYVHTYVANAGLRVWPVHAHTPARVCACVCTTDTCRHATVSLHNASICLPVCRSSTGERERERGEYRPRLRIGQWILLCRFLDRRYPMFSRISIRGLIIRLSDSMRSFRRGVNPRAISLSKMHTVLEQDRQQFTPHNSVFIGKKKKKERLTIRIKLSLVSLHFDTWQIALQCYISSKQFPFIDNYKMAPDRAFASTLAPLIF